MEYYVPRSTKAVGTATISIAEEDEKANESIRKIRTWLKEAGLQLTEKSQNT